MPRVMISYRNVDGQKEFAIELEKMLSDAGIDTWLDVNKIDPGSPWEKEIFKGIKESDYVVLCLSPEYFESEMCMTECYLARGYGKKLLPVILPNDGNQRIFELTSTNVVTEGIEDLHIIDTRSYIVQGLAHIDPVSAKKLENHVGHVSKALLKAINEPYAPDINYDVYISFRSNYWEFATRIANDLNKANINTFVTTISLDVGSDWRRMCWNALLNAKSHIVILSPEIASSPYIANEVLISRTKETLLLPVLPMQFVSDKGRKIVNSALAQNDNLRTLQQIQFINEQPDYHTMLETLKKLIRKKLLV